MMNKYMIKTFALSVLAAMILGISGCSDKPSATSKNIEQTTTIAGSVVDGYLRYSTVCLDLNNDNFCQVTEPFTITAKDGSYTLTLSDAQKADGNYTKAQLVVYGGQDSDRPGEDFIGKLKSPNDGSGIANVTPVTSLISAYIERSGVSNITKAEIDAATAKVAAVLNLSAEQVLADPRKTNDQELMNATLQLQYAVNTMSSATDGDKKEVAGDIFAAFAAGLDNISGTTDVASGIQAIIEKADAVMLNEIDPNLATVKEVAKVAATNIDTVMAEEGMDVSDIITLNEALTKVVVLQGKLIEEVEATTDYTFIDATAFDYTSEIATIDFEEEAAKIYLADLDVNITAADFNITAYAGKISFDKDLEELALEFAGDTIILEAVTTKIAEIEEEVKKIEDERIEALIAVDGAEKIGALKADVDAIFATTKVARVADAKNLVNQVREGVLTFIDPDLELNQDQNISTIVGSQANTIKNKIKPTVETIVSDFNTSANSLQTSVEGFLNSIETNFADVFGSNDPDTDEYTAGSIENRIRAIDTVASAYDYDATWGPVNTSSGDSVSHTYTKVDTLITEVFTINGMSLTAKYTDENNNGPQSMQSISTSGTITFSEVGAYNLNISALSFANNKATFRATGEITGLDNSSMKVTTMNISVDTDMTKNDIDIIKSISADIDAEIVSSGRTLSGTLVLGATSNTLTGTYTGKTGEPTFTGTVTATVNHEKLFGVLVEQAGNWIERDALLMVTFTDGTESFVESYTQSYTEVTDSYVDGGVTYTNTYFDYSKPYYVLTTQNNESITCTGEYTSTDISTSYSVSCVGGNVQPYNDNNKIVTLKVDGVEKTVKEAWTYWGTDMITPRIDLSDGTYIYYGTNGLEVDGAAVTISDISQREPRNIDELGADFKFVGSFTHKDISISATFGLVHRSSSEYFTIYAENIAIVDGDNFVKLARAELVAKKAIYLDSKNNDNDYGNSNFVSYSYYYDYSSYGEEYNPLTDIVSAKVDNIELSIKDADGAYLTMSADLSYAPNDFAQDAVHFNGTYDYAGTTFNGVLDVTLDNAMDTISNTQGAMQDSTVSFKVSGDVNSSSGFEPFSITAAGNIGNTVDAYAIITRGADYKIAFNAASEVNAITGEHISVYSIGDSNGVQATYFDTWIDCSEVTTTCVPTESAPFSLTLKNILGTDLATFGEAATGNNWEIVYSDDTTETLF